MSITWFIAASISSLIIAYFTGKNKGFSEGMNEMEKLYKEHMSKMNKIHYDKGLTAGRTMEFERRKRVSRWNDTKYIH